MRSDSLWLDYRRVPRSVGEGLLMFFSQFSPETKDTTTKELPRIAATSCRRCQSFKYVAQGYATGKGFCKFNNKGTMEFGTCGAFVPYMVAQRKQANNDDD
jgi:hypothetical protein